MEEVPAGAGEGSVGPVRGRAGTRGPCPEGLRVRLEEGGPSAEHLGLVSRGEPCKVPEHGRACSLRLIRPHGQCLLHFPSSLPRTRPAADLGAWGSPKWWDQGPQGHGFPAREPPRRGPQPATSSETPSLRKSWPRGSPQLREAGARRDDPVGNGPWSFELPWPTPHALPRPQAPGPHSRHSAWSPAPEEPPTAPPGGRGAHMSDPAFPVCPSSLQWPLGLGGALQTPQDLLHLCPLPGRVHTTELHTRSSVSGAPGQLGRSPRASGWPPPGEEAALPA